MANIVIREILASDTVSDLVDKVNFNFDQLLLNGGGPAGPIGGSGPAGPLGPRGSIWFTANDIYNTSTTTTPDPPLVFPLWSGTPQKVNNSALPGYPQFALDPNRYLPAAETVTGTYPENSFIIGTTGKIPRSGDLYLQETDDTFDSLSSIDGDIWEFNGVNQTWTYTGVNIKGDTGTTGANGFTEWVRTNDASPALNDFLRPDIITANDPIVRVVIGVGDATQASDIITDGSVYTDNVLTLFSEAPSLGNPESYRSQIALTDEYSIQAPASSTYDYANIYTVNNTLNLYGFNDAGATNDDYNINVVARSGIVLLESINPVLTSTQSALLNTNSRQFEITNGALSVSVPPVTPSSANTGGSIVTHRLADTSVAFDITHNSNLSSSYPGYWPVGPQGKSIRLLTTDQNTGASQTYLNLQTFTNGRIGIGYFGAAGINNVNGKLAINGGSSYPSGNSVSNITFPGIIVGNTWSNSTSITFNNPGGSTDPGIIGNSIFLEGQLSSARNISTPTQLVTLGTSAFNSINVYSSINMQQGMIGFNSYKPGGTGKLASMGSTDAGGNWYIGPGSWLHQYIPATGTTDNLVNSLVIGGNTTNNTTQDSTYVNLRTSIMIDTVEQQVLLNSQARFTPAGNVRMPNFISHGGAIIGRVRPSNIPTLIFGHEDEISNKNVIIGYPSGTATLSTSPRIITTTPGDTLVSSRSNHTYIGTPVFNGSFNFTQSDELRTATNTSITSFSGGVYNTYFPSSYSQFKIIHGVNYTLAPSSSFLSTTQNPYDAGLGLELESRSLYLDYGNPGGGYENIARTPIVLGSSGTQIKGNRSLLVTKSSITSTNNITTYSPIVLFEIAPTNHVAIGKAIVFPLKSVNVGATSLKSATPGGGAADTTITISNIVTNLTSTNAGRWADISQGITVITPDTSRSLLISRISVGSRPSGNMLDLDQNAFDIQAGITIDLGAYITGTTSSILPALLQSYKNSVSPNSASITSSNIAYSSKSGNPAYGLLTGAPLGIKPGYIVHDDVGTGTSSRFMKGVDTFIEGGDLFYSGSQYPFDGMNAGDVYLSGGQTYKEFLGVSGGISGFGDPVVDFSDSNFGNVYLATRLTSYSNASYTAPGPSRAGNVYVGYSSDVAGNFKANVFRPTGNALLNVSAPTQSVESVSIPIDAQAAGRAINIQRGDIVTRNQDAGWTEINLVDTQFINQVGQQGGSNIFESENIFCYNGANIGAKTYFPTSSVFGYNINPQWKIRYKVIGYTVHYIISLVALRWTVIASNAAKGDLIFLTNANNLFSTNPNTSLLPRPKLGWTSAYPAVGQSFNMPFNQESASFSGSGHMYLHQSPTDANFPWTNVGLLGPITVTPIAAAYDFSQDRITIYKSGSSMFMSDTATDYSNQGVERYLSSRFLIPLNGRNMGDSSNAAVGTQIPVDVYISGTYELDPQYWFPS